MTVNLEWDIKKNDKLNSKFFTDNKLNKKSRVAMLKTIKHFLEYIKFPNTVKINDVIFTGSLANYNYNESSDIDLHIMIDYEDISDEKEYLKTLFLKVKNLYQDNFDITIHGFPVEIFIEDNSERENKPWKSSYSLFKDQWINQPSNKEVKINKENIINKTKDLIIKINKNIKEKNVESLEKLLDTIKLERSESLEKEKSEYASDNLVFKLLRNSGTLEKASEFIESQKAKELSVDEQKN